MRRKGRMGVLAVSREAAVLTSEEWRIHDESDQAIYKRYCVRWRWERLVAYMDYMALWQEPLPGIPPRTVPRFDRAECGPAIKAAKEAA